MISHHQVPLELFAANPLEGRRKKRKSGESAYEEAFITRRDAYLCDGGQTATPVLARKLRRICADTGGDIKAKILEQEKYFKGLDEGALALPGDASIFATTDISAATKEWEEKFKLARASLEAAPKMHEPSETVVMEAVESLGMAGEKARAPGTRP